MKSYRSMDVILASERAFHDRRFAEGDTRQAQKKFYWAIADGAHAFHDRVAELSAGRDVLEYGCGAEALAGRIAPVARSIHAIDISDEAVRQALLASDAPNAQFSVMDAMNLDFPDDSFDLVFGSGIIHHLDISLCAQTLARVLRPGGHALFWEPLGLNPAIGLYRALTPAARTPDEHPLRPADITTLKTRFASVELSFYGLSTLAAVPLRGTRTGARLRAGLRACDRTILRVPGLRWLAWYALIDCRMSEAAARRP
jgi:SAM-dependent methyltransferase